MSHLLQPADTLPDLVYKPCSFLYTGSVSLALCELGVEFLGSRTFGTERRRQPITGGPMAKKLYVGNLPYSFQDSDLGDAFSPYGAVESARVITDRDTGRSKGFGFVEMANDGEAMKAIQELNGKDIGGRALRVDEATERPRGGGGGGGGGDRGGRSRGPRY
jgi:cold-inducible RNA-binding protein